MWTESPVLVGYDGSREGERALRWAVDEAWRRRVPLVVCHCWHWAHPGGGRRGRTGRGIVRDLGEQILREGLSLAAALSPQLDIRARLAEGPAVEALVHAAAGAQLVVLGTQAGAGRTGGATVQGVAARAGGPLVAVRDADPGDGRIVIGFDGSLSAMAAVAFGFREAALHGWRVHVIQAGTAEPANEVDEVIRSWHDRYPNLDAKVTRTAGEPRLALLDAAAGAQMLAVGRRGLGGFPALLLGSVSQAMLQHAPCPVAMASPSSGTVPLGPQSSV